MSDHSAKKMVIKAEKIFFGFQRYFKDIYIILYQINVVNFNVSFQIPFSVRLLKY